MLYWTLYDIYFPVMFGNKLSEIEILSAVAPKHICAYLFKLSNGISCFNRSHYCNCGGCIPLDMYMMSFVINLIIFIIKGDLFWSTPAVGSAIFSSHFVLISTISVFFMTDTWVLSKTVCLFVGNFALPVVELGMYTRCVVVPTVVPSHTVRVLLYFVVLGFQQFHPYSAGLLHWHRTKRMVVSMKHIGRECIDVSNESIMDW